MITHLLAGVDRAMTSSSTDGDNQNIPSRRSFGGGGARGRISSGRDNKTPSISDIVDPELRLMLIDLKRLLHCMEENESGLPSNDTSWQSILFRAQLAQDIWKRISSNCSMDPITTNRSKISSMDPIMYRQLAHQVDHCCRRAHVVASQLRQKEEEDQEEKQQQEGAIGGGSTNLVERIFFQQRPSTEEEPTEDGEED